MDKKATEDKNLAHAQKETVPELEELKEFWGKHGDKISYALLAVLVLVIGYQQYGKWRVRNSAESFMELTAADTPELLEQFIAKNQSPDHTALARLRLAKNNYAEGKYQNAKEIYEAFLKAHPRNPQSDIAKIGVAFCAEALGEADEAAKLFKNFADANPDSYLAPQARIGLGRALILAGKKDEGKQVLDLFITECAGTEWARQADEVLRNRNRLTIPKPVDQIDFNSFFNVSPDSISLGAPTVSETAETPVADDAAADDAVADGEE